MQVPNDRAPDHAEAACYDCNAAVVAAIFQEWAVGHGLFRQTAVVRQIQSRMPAVTVIRPMLSIDIQAQIMK